MRDTLFSALPLVCGVPILVLFGLFIVRARSIVKTVPVPPGQEHLIATASVWLAQAQSTLVPWDAVMLADIARTPGARWRYTVTDNVSGVIRLHRSGQPVIAFAGIKNFQRLIILARTSHAELVLTQEDRVVHIQIDGMPFGAWDLRTGVLTDGRGLAIGLAQRPSATAYNRPRRTVNDQMYDVQLYGRTCATMLAQAGMSWPWNGRGGNQRPAITLHGPLQHPGDAGWLLALATFDGAQRSS